MTKENLLRYLRDPEYLHQISYQELKTLVAEHPNSYTLRHLLAIKSRQEGNDDYNRQKEFASLYSIDRPHLFDILTRAEILEALPEGVLLQEDYLELKELSALEKELSMTSIAGSFAASASVAAVATALPDVPNVPVPKESLLSLEFGEKAVEEDQDSEEYYTLDFDQEILEPSLDLEAEAKREKINGSIAEIEAIFEDVDTPEIEQIPHAAKEVSIESITNDDNSDDVLANADFIEIPLDIVSSEEQETNEQESEEQETYVEQAALEEKSGLAPLPKSRFSTWNKPKPEFAGYDLIGYNSKGMIDELANKRVRKTTTETTIIPQKINKVAETADDSLEFESDIASETLAKILIIQGHYTKAISMYKRLSLIFPEKSGLFAAEIKKIENLEDRSA